jgi:hypothetical protein
MVLASLAGGEDWLLASLPQHVREHHQAEPVDQARCHQVAH